MVQILLDGTPRQLLLGESTAIAQFSANSAASSATAASASSAKASNAVPFATWSALAAATGMAAGDRATVRADDSGTHTDPVVGGTVKNAGIYTYSASPAGWQRVADLDSQLTSGIFTQIVGGPRIVATDESGNELIEITANRIDHPDVNAIRAQAATSATAGQAMVATPGGARLTVTDESGNELLEVTQSRIEHPDMNAVRPLALASATAGQSMAGLPGAARVAITDEAGNVMAEVTSTRINHPDTNAMRAAIATPSAGTLRRLRALAAAAAVSNPWDNPVMASPPTMTADATIDSSLTRQFRPTSGGVLANNDFGLFGGVPVVTGGLPTMTYLSAVTRGTGTTASGGNINGSGKTQYGQRIRFQHFGTKFDFLTYGTARWRLIVNGQYASRSFLTSSAGPTANPSYNHVVFSSIGIRNIEIELDGGTPFGGVNCEPTGYIEQPGFDDALRMIVVGDSFTVGQLSSAFHNSWTQILARKLGIADVIANGLGGTGLINAGSVWNAAAHITDITDASPDIIGLAMGFNDQASSTAAIQAAATSWIASVRALNAGQFANTPIFVFGPWSGSTGPSATMIGVENAIAAAVAAARSAGDSSIWFLPNCTALTRPPIYGTGWVGGENGTGSSDLLTSNTDATTTHPNDLGHEVLASYFNNVIRSIVLRSNSI